MRFLDQVKVWSGESVLVALGAVRVLSFIPGVRPLYRALLLRLVRNTRLFDESYYRENNPDIAVSQINELFHYIAYGDREGRSPMALFDPVFYRKSAPGWTASINTLLHFTLVGRYRRLATSPWFDVEYYLANNKDVARSGVNPLRHYLNWGGMHGRSPCAHFDSAFYLKKYRDVLESRVNPLLHYLMYGRFEGRSTLPECSAAGEPESDEPLPLPAYPSEEEWLALERHATDRQAEVDVIIPVYKGRPETLRCIYSVLASKCERRYELVVINDASPDDALVAELQHLAGLKLFTYLENRKNRGFVHTVNRGMSLHVDRDVVLLNADTEVYGGWLDRLSNTARSSAAAGTVTPLSNNATICSYPYFPRDYPFPLEIEYGELDALLARTNPGESVEAPTGVGFCMYIKRACLEDVGLFDELNFGRGYGEENDFCQRAIAKGWRNLIAADLFVRHWGCVSFQGEKARLVSNALRQIEKKHPQYLSDVADFIKREPLAELYQRIDWARMLRLKREKNVLLISHSRGGGTERRVQEDIDRFMDEGYGVYLMRPVPGARGKVALGHPQARGLPNLAPVEWSDFTALKKIVEELGITTVYSHSFVDFIKEAPLYLKRLVERAGVEWVMTLHDYEMICPRINLVDDNGFYCGEPSDDGCNQCLAVHGSSFAATDISEWRAIHRSAMAAAAQVIVPDRDVAKRLRRYAPEVEVEVRPHEQIDPVSIRAVQAAVASDETLRIVVIGAISKLKGYEVLLQSARNARHRRLPLEFTLVGYSMNDRLLEESGVRVTGKYKESEVDEMLRQASPHVVWLPSISPESYSYTLSIALQAGRPVLAFDIGAIARRLREYGLGQLLMPLEMVRDEAEINNYLLSYRESVVKRVVRNEQAAKELEVAVVAAYE
jgi:GT2 family glycosyltransferase